MLMPIPRFTTSPSHVSQGANSHPIAAIARGDREHAAIAIAHGYADQAHLVHELGAIAGTTPGALARERGSISPITSVFGVAEERA
ncbi:MAG: hypothetical protein SFX73_03555 [Kofleriaceae bacterium]|nr:hypothetical protein [Kofleriaceae bacterium]